MQYYENVKLSTRDREEYTGHEKLWVFIVAANPRSKKSSTAPRLSLRADQPFSLVFFSFLVEFHRDRGIEWKGILYAAYPVLLQSPTTHIPCILQRFWHTLSHARILAYILLRNETLLFPKWHQKPTPSILRYSSVMNMEMSKIINFENLLKINKNSYNDNFFAVLIRRKRIFILSKNIFWG